MNKNDLGRSVIMEMGLYIGKDNILRDQDTNMQIAFGGKNVKYTYNDPSKLYIGENDVLFDPVDNYKLMNNMLGYYIDKENESGNMSSVAPYMLDGDNRTVCQGVKLTNGERIEGGYFRNRSLSICDFILKCAGDTSDIHNLDEM